MEQMEKRVNSGRSSIDVITRCHGEVRNEDIKNVVKMENKILIFKNEEVISRSSILCYYN